MQITVSPAFDMDLFSLAFRPFHIHMIMHSCGGITRRTPSRWSVTADSSPFAARSLVPTPNPSPSPSNFRFEVSTRRWNYWRHRRIDLTRVELSESILTTDSKHAI